MNLTVYYDKIRECETRIAGEFAVIISNETADGGKAGQLTEAPARVAAKMIVEGRAHLADAAVAANFRKMQAEAKEAADRMAAAAKVELAVVTAAELDRLKGTSKKA